MNELSNCTARTASDREEVPHSLTLPAILYTDSTIFEEEREAIFFRNWWHVAHVCRLSESGSYVTAAINDQHIFVIRGTDGTLRGFYNVCQHRGHVLLKGEGRVHAVVCPYHAWTYGTDGELRRALNSENVPAFDPTSYGLKPIRVEVFAGFVFVNLDPDAAPLSTRAQNLESEIRSYIPRLDDMTFVRRYTYEINANWKVMIDNFLECYHCAMGHRDFTSMVEMSSYRTRVHDIYSSHIADGVRTTGGTAYKFEKGDVDFGFAGWFLWPNLAIRTFPGDACVATLQMIPAGPDRTIEHQDWYCVPPGPSKQLTDTMSYTNDTLVPEDIALCESVQRGLRSKGYSQGRLMIDNGLSEISEHAIDHFKRLVCEALGTAAESK
jgi:choline monooxygenase